MNHNNKGQFSTKDTRRGTRESLGRCSTSCRLRVNQLFRGAPVRRGSLTQKLTDQSTVEKELITATYIAQEQVYLSNLLRE